MANYKIIIEVEANSESEMWVKLSDATMAAENSFKEGSWSWEQHGWSVNIDVDGEEELGEDE